MSIGPTGIAASVAGTPLSQKKGSAVERAKEEIGIQRRQLDHNQKAEAAAGVGEPDGEHHETAERDGDGRRPWEDSPAPGTTPGHSDVRQSKDPLQQSGNLLDLTG
jgi:hypothetical protein